MPSPAESDGAFGATKTAGGSTGGTNDPHYLLRLSFTFFVSPHSHAVGVSITYCVSLEIVTNSPRASNARFREYPYNTPPLESHTVRVCIVTVTGVPLPARLHDPESAESPLPPKLVAPAVAPKAPRIMTIGCPPAFPTICPTA